MRDVRCIRFKKPCNRQGQRRLLKVVGPPFTQNDASARVNQLDVAFLYVSGKSRKVPILAPTPYVARRSTSTSFIFLHSIKTWHRHHCAPSEGRFGRHPRSTRLSSLVQPRATPLYPHPIQRSPTPPDHPDPPPLHSSLANRPITLLSPRSSPHSLLLNLLSEKNASSPSRHTSRLYSHRGHHGTPRLPWATC